MKKTASKFFDISCVGSPTRSKSCVRRMNNSQFWTWTDHWQGWDWMREEEETELELAEWCDETLWMICLMCGSPVEGCMCENIEDATPIPPLVDEQEHPSQ